jgi:hypothetical protein
MMNATPIRILFSGMVAGDPHQGGATWAVLQYLLGFKRLGHDVLFVESVRPGRVRPAGGSFPGSVNAEYFRDVVNRFDLRESAALLLEGSRETVGLPYEKLVRRAAEADLLVNVSGMLTDVELTGGIGVRVYLDLDPAFVQLWHAQGIDMRFAGHTHFVTVGQSIGQPDCPVPTAGLNWVPSFQPVVLSEWPPGEAIAYDGLTTIANWRGYGSVEHDGRFYGQKVHSFRELMDLPTLTHERCIPALAIHAGETRDWDALTAHGWHILNPLSVAGTPDAYRSFVRGSKAELGVAKAGYVTARCGWFSDRSACYLAAGRPVIAQDTGFSHGLPTGEGLFTFRTTGEALSAIEALNTDYPRHAKAARAVAEAFFDSDKVLPRLLNAVGTVP